MSRDNTKVSAQPISRAVLMFWGPDSQEPAGLTLSADVIEEVFWVAHHKPRAGRWYESGPAEQLVARWLGEDPRAVYRLSPIKLARRIDHELAGTAGVLELTPDMRLSNHRAAARGPLATQL